MDVTIDIALLQQYGINFICAGLKKVLKNPALDTLLNIKASLHNQIKIALKKVNPPWPVVLKKLMLLWFYVN